MPPAVTPSFDTWTSLFLIVCAFGFFLAITLLISRSFKKQNWPVLLIISGFSFILLEYVFYWTGHSKTNGYLYFFSHSWYLSFGPLLYGYVIRFYREAYRISKFHFLLPVLSFISGFYFLIISEGFTTISAHQNDVLYYYFRVLRSPWLAAFSMLFYLFATLDFISFQEMEKKNEYTQIRNKWARLLILLFFIFTAAYISYYVLVRFSFFNPAWDYAISISMSISIYTIGYFVYKEPSIFNGELFSNLFIKGASNSNQFSEETKEEFYTTLLKYIKENKPYRDNNLRLAQLADKVGFSSHTLSKIINEKSEKNFNKFINEFRLQEAERLLRAEKNMNIKTIYYEVGFNNKATFYQAFKNKNHCTPLEYKEKSESVYN